jgi:hypothetical protein
MLHTHTRTHARTHTHTESRTGTDAACARADAELWSVASCRTGGRPLHVCNCCCICCVLPTDVGRVLDQDLHEVPRGQLHAQRCRTRCDTALRDDASPERGERAGRSRRRCGRGEPSLGADVGGVSPVLVQMWAGQARRFRRRCGGAAPRRCCRGRPEFSGSRLSTKPSRQNKETNKQTNKRTNKKRNNQTDRRMNTHTSTQRTPEPSDATQTGPVGSRTSVRPVGPRLPPRQPRPRRAPRCIPAFT